MIGGGPTEQTEPSSKAELLTSLVNGTMPSMGQHEFQIHTNYVVCQKCGIRHLKNSSRDKLVAMASNKCWDEQWQPEGQWTGRGACSGQGGKLQRQQTTQAKVWRHTGATAAAKLLQAQRGRFVSTEKERRKNNNIYIYIYTVPTGRVGA